MCVASVHLPLYTYQITTVSVSYRAGGSLERPGWAADAVAVISMVGGQTGGAGGEGGGHREGSAGGVGLRHTAAVVVHVPVL